MNKAIVVLGLLAIPSIAHAQLMTQPEMREYVERALQQNTIPIEMPYFTPFRDGNGLQYEYSLGGVKAQSFTTSYAGTGLLAIPLEEQFRASIIRKYRNGPRPRQFWLSRLAQVENEIAIMLQETETPGDERERWERVTRHSEHIRQIYHQAMIDAGIITANSPLQQSPCHACSQGYSIAISTIPEWGLVRYLPAGDWDLYDFRTRIKGEPNVQKPEWLTVQQGTVDLGGKYWFSVSWNGIERYKQMIHVTRQEPLVFRPER